MARACDRQWRFARDIEKFRVKNNTTFDHCHAQPDDDEVPSRVLNRVTHNARNAAKSAKFEKNILQSQ